MNRKSVAVTATLALFVAVFMVAIGALGNLPIGTTTVSLSTSSDANANANSVTLPGGYTVPVKGGEAALQKALQGGPLASDLNGSAALKSTVVGLESPQYQAIVSSVPTTIWTLLSNAAAVRLNGGTEAQVSAILTPAIDANTAFGIALGISLIIIAVGCISGIGCAFALAIAGLIVGVAVIIAVLTGNTANQQRLDAAAEEGTIMGDIRNVLENNANTTRTIMNDLNLTYIALTWEAANAALSQLGNATFNEALDAFQSGILPQLVSTVEGVIAPMAGTIAEGMYDNARIYGPGGHYGSQGISCIITLQATSSYASQAFSDPNLYSGYSPESPACYGQTGSVGNEIWQGTGNPSVSPGVYPGVDMNFGSISGGTSPATEYYIPHGAGMDAVFTTAGPGETTGPRVGIQLIPVPGTGGTAWYNTTVSNMAYTTSACAAGTPPSECPFTNVGTEGNGGAFVASSPTGVYYVNQLNDCSTPSFSSCQAQTFSTYNARLIGVDVLPVDSLTTGGSTLAASFNLTGPVSGQEENLMAINCGDQLGAPSVQSQLLAPNSGAVPFSVCDPTTGYVLTEMDTLLESALNVGYAYWTFLTDPPNSYTNENQIPTRCIIPNPADIIAPNVAGGAAYLASLNVTTLLNLYAGYLAVLSHTFNATANLTNGSFGSWCGHKIVCPNGNTNGLCNNIAGIGDAPVIALGDIYVPPIACEDDVGYTCPHEQLGVPSTWAVAGTQMLWEPATGTLNLTLNTTMVLPHANPSDLIYTGNNSTGLSLNCQTGRFNVTTCVPYHTSSVYLVPQFGFHVTGNSTNSSASPYPTHIYAAWGAGWAVFVTACATITLKNFTGNWTDPQNYTTQATTCSFNESEIQSWITNDSCIFDTAACGHCQGYPNCHPCLLNCPCLTNCGGGGCAGTGDLNAWYDSWMASIVNGVAGPISGIPIIGVIGCDVGWTVLIILLILFTALIVWVAVTIVRLIRG